MSSRLLTLTGLASVAAIALAWSAFAADNGGSQGDRNGNGDSQRWELPAPPPGAPGANGDQMFHSQAPVPGAEGEDGEVVPLPPPPHGGPGGPLGHDGGELTWGELHVQREGEAVTLRIDHGEVAAVDSDSIVVSENDGNEVEIPVDDETEVMAGPFEAGETSVEDLEEGDTVHVVREEDGAAEKIGVLPDPEELERHFEQMAPGRNG
jgi:hypothetical protein